MGTTGKLGTRQYAIIGLTIATALIHIVLGIGSGGMFLVIFLLNGLGYLGLMAAFYFLPQLAKQRSLVRWAYIGFTAVTFILYFAFNWPDVWAPMGLVDKAIELVLLVLLFQEPA